MANEYPCYLLNIFDNIDVNIPLCNSFIGYSISHEDFNKSHDFGKVMNSFVNYLEGVVIEVSHGDYFIIKRSDDYYFAVFTVERCDDYIFWILSYDNLNDIRYHEIFSELDSEYGNYIKYYRM